MYTHPKIKGCSTLHPSATLTEVLPTAQLKVNRKHVIALRQLQNNYFDRTGFYFCLKSKVFITKGVHPRTTFPLKTFNNSCKYGVPFRNCSCDMFLFIVMTPTLNLNFHLCHVMDQRKIDYGVNFL